jgi:stalled ribosome rescue protein Dom34
LDKNQTLRNFKVIVKDKKYLNEIVRVLNLKNESKSVSSPSVSKEEVYEYLREQIPELN